MERCAHLGVFGRGSKGPLGSVQVGDRIVAYIRGEKAIAGLGTVTEPYYLDNTEIFEGDLYPDRLGINLVLLEPAQSKPLETLLDKLTFYSNRDRWFAPLAGGIAQIPLNDYRVIEEQLQQALPID